MQSIEGISALLRMTAYSAEEAERLGLRFVKYCLDMAHSELTVVCRKAERDGLAIAADPAPRPRGRPRRVPTAANDPSPPAAE